MDLVQVVASPVLLVVDMFGIISPIFLIGLLVIPFVLGFQFEGTFSFKCFSASSWLLPWVVVGVYWYFRESKGFSALIESAAVVSLSVVGSLVARRIYSKHDKNFHFYIVVLVAVSSLYLAYTASFVGK